MVCGIRYFPSVQTYVDTTATNKSGCLANRSSYEQPEVHSEIPESEVQTYAPMAFEASSTPSSNWIMAKTA